MADNLKITVLRNSQLSHAGYNNRQSLELKQIPIEVCLNEKLKSVQITKDSGTCAHLAPIFFSFPECLKA